MKDSGDFLDQQDNDMPSMSPDADMASGAASHPEGGNAQEVLNPRGSGLYFEGVEETSPPSPSPPPTTAQSSAGSDGKDGELSLELEFDKESSSDIPLGSADSSDTVEADGLDDPVDLTPDSPAAPEENKKSQRLGDRLVSEGVITPDQLEVALHEQKKVGGMVGETLVGLGFITSDILSGILSETTGYEEFKPASTIVDSEALALLDKNTAMRFRVLPVSIKENTVHMAMVDPYDVMTLDQLRQILPKHLVMRPMICAPALLNNTIDRVYGYASSTKDILNELAGKKIDLEGIEGLTEDNAYSHPIVRLVNALVIDAVKMGASDLHFEPEENFVRLRYRVDGILITVQTFHKEYWQAIGQRLKIMSGMNIADKLLPQDGRFYLNVGGREADFRVSSLPTVNGENFVLRVLDKQSGIMPLEDLGFSDHNMRLIRKSQARPEGIIIVTGPTGSGKTTSLYSMLNKINTPDVNIMTLEDPVEYSLPMIRQTHVRGGGGLSFADGVKALLRQDPDIIFIGEVRDGVTAEQALKAAMTGHQVYTTLHTNDCFGAIPRLLDLGIKPGMLAGAIVASFAQRLVRRLCDCKEMRIATEEECRLLAVDPANPPEIGHAKGCEKCNGSGYKGRVAVVEILFTNEAINDVIADGGQKTLLKKVARENGFKSMLDDGIEKILLGQTSIEALMKSVDFSERM